MIWVDIPGHQGYRAGLNGQIMSLKEGEPRILKPKVDSNTGYLRIELSQNGKVTYGAVHQLIALAFLGRPPEGHQVCHNNGNKLDNRAGNLRYDTPKANTQDSITHGTHYSVVMASRDRCAQGHEFTPENTMRRKGRNGNTIRKCKECHRIVTARYRAKKAATPTGDRGEGG